VGSFDFPESVILGRIYGGALERVGYQVRYVEAIGPRELVVPALQQGLIGIVPEYTGSLANYLAGEEVATAERDAMYARVADRLPPMGLAALAPAPADNHNTIAVTRSIAERLGLRSISDLRAHAGGMDAGGPPECPGRPLCLPGLERLYGLRFRSFIPYPNSVVTGAALQAGAIDAGVVFSTDGVMDTRDLVELRDDRGLQPAEQVVPVVRADLIERSGPELARTIDAISSQLETSDLRELNRTVTVAGTSPAIAAEAWLDAHATAEAA
jgi:osmoprotectant transport system substrate-binding protein